MVAKNLKSYSNLQFTSIYLVLAELLVHCWRQTKVADKLLISQLKTKPSISLDNVMCGLPPAEYKLLS